MSDGRTMTLSYRFDASPTAEQKEKLSEQQRIHRDIYNRALDELDKANEFVSKYDMHKRLTQWKKGEHPEFADVNSKAAQQTIARIYDAIEGMKTKKQRGESVGRLRHKTAFTTIEYNQSGFDVRDGEVYLHNIGDVAINKHRSIPDDADVKGVIIKDYGFEDYKVILQLEISRPERSDISEDADVVGIDLNVSNFSTDSGALRIRALKRLLKSEWKRVKKEQQNLSRKEKGSENWKKNHRRLKKAWSRLRDKRRDFLHKLSTWYVENHDVIAVEDLDAKNLSESESSELNRHIANHAWNEFTSMLAYKALQAGKHVIEVDSEYTTQDCSTPGCDSRYKKPLSERTHRCRECGLETDRDHNAAVNIENRAHNLIGMGRAESTPVDTSSSGELTRSSPRQVVEAGNPGI